MLCFLFWRFVQVSWLGDLMTGIKWSLQLMANAQPALIDLGSWQNVFLRCSGWAGRPMGVLGAAPLQVHVDVEGKARQVGGVLGG